MNLLRYILQKFGLIRKVSKVIINEKLNTIIIFEFDKEIESNSHNTRSSSKRSKTII